MTEHSNEVSANESLSLSLSTNEPRCFLPTTGIRNTHDVDLELSKPMVLIEHCNNAFFNKVSTIRRWNLSKNYTEPAVLKKLPQVVMCAHL